MTTSAPANTPLPVLPIAAALGLLAFGALLVGRGRGARSAR